MENRYQVLTFINFSTLSTFQLYQPYQPYQLCQLFNSINSINPINPINPINTINPINSINPINPINSINPINPINHPSLNPPPLHFLIYQHQFSAHLPAYAAVFLGSAHEVGDYVFYRAKWQVLAYRTACFSQVKCNVIAHAI